MLSDSSIQWSGWFVRPQVEHWQKGSEAVSRAGAGGINVFFIQIFICIRPIYYSWEMRKLASLLFHICVRRLQLTCKLSYCFGKKLVSNKISFVVQIWTWQCSIFLSEMGGQNLTLLFLLYMTRILYIDYFHLLFLNTMVMGY